MRNGAGFWLVTSKQKVFKKLEKQCVGFEQLLLRLLSATSIGASFPFPYSHATFHLPTHLKLPPRSHQAHHITTKPTPLHYYTFTHTSNSYSLTHSSPYYPRQHKHTVHGSHPPPQNYSVHYPFSPLIHLHLKPHLTHSPHTPQTIVYTTILSD